MKLPPKNPYSIVYFPLLSHIISPLEFISLLRPEAPPQLDPCSIHICPLDSDVLMPRT